MHDTPSAGRRLDQLPAILATAVLLALLPLVFTNTLTTLDDPFSLAVHAYQLAQSDTVPSHGSLSLPGMPPPPPGTIAFGVHDLYPIRFFTARDLVTGDVLSRAVFPGDFAGRSGSAVWDSLEVQFRSDGRGSTAIVGSRGSPSWPEELFSIITHR